MRLRQAYSCDVLVIGAGIAGISAALEAAEAGRSVTLVSSSRTFSGSSFYPGTWGLGLIGPADETDRQDLKETILDVGCGMADPALVDTFVDHIHPAIQKVRDMGVRLRRAEQGAQKEFIPCFDHKHRDWNGLEFDSVRTVFSQRMDDLGVQLLPHCALMELVIVDSAVCGAVLLEEDRPIYLGCKALVLASGGYGTLFRYHLCTEDVSGLGQSLALQAGCSLVNMEFMQMMPGYLRPAAKTIYNEKVFRFTQFHLANGEPLFPSTPQWKELLEVRSTHGPFTSRLPSKQIDLELFHAFQNDPQGVTASYTQEMRQHPPEFVKTYFDWLYEAKGLTMEDPIQLGIFAHAANGGIHIQPDASTGVPGLFACGEVTGGMHGADRIGGLSTANGLVFGGIAGRSAAASVQDQPTGPDSWDFGCRAFPQLETLQTTLRELMFQSAMVIRSEAGLCRGLEQLGELRKTNTVPTEDGRAMAKTRRLEGQLLTATCILEAALARKESRGSHYREDYPVSDPAQARPMEVRCQNGALVLHPLGVSEKKGNAR